MAAAFQKCAFQQRPGFQADPCGPVRRPVGWAEGGPGRRRHRRPDPWSKTFSREHWKELRELVRAEADAAVEANRQDDAALAAAAEAAREAAEALQLAEETETVNRDIARVTASLNAAMAAKLGAERLKAAQFAEMEAKALSGYLAMLEDEEECELLLLLN